MKENQDRNIQNVYRQIVEISKKYQVKKVVLFGSRARGTNMPKSDIDLAIYGCADFGGLSDSLNEDLWSLLKLDIINMDNKYVSSELVSEIEKDGVVLMKKFDQYVRHLQVLCRAEQEDVWLEMLRDRNDATHIYNEEAAQQLVEKILHQYIGVFVSLEQQIRARYGDEVLEQL